MEQIETVYDLLSKGHSPMVDDWFLMKTPLPAMAILVAYLYFVLKWGPNYMENRKPMDLKKSMILYNASQVILSLVLCCMAFVNREVATQVFTLGCRSNVTISGSLYIKLWTGAWMYYLAKIIELLDTVFFVLRKNQRQVTFLHVYHHTVMVLWAYYYLKYAFGEQGVAIGFMNSFVHIIMYSYYLLAALGPHMKKYLWWKKYLTGLQLVQFCTMIAVLGITSILDCNVPKQVTIILSFLVVSFLVLFSRFYIQSYHQGKAIAGTAKNAIDKNNNVESFAKHQHVKKIK